ncbi:MULTISPECIES: hypothetical protein [unclassified Collinsella]|uniref:hypothetical protein n=1 Tax=unclassified Collinsella TaxID=2637548 RepID=UPI000E4F1D2F|nr:MULTISPECIES: hypothetical protein [unclassified Collinsella]RGT46076.1 hypothetical protein DWX25_05725 [Collinsella sp. AF18-8LB]RGT50791.1 hypothetical protein DWX24_05635 [Collinsella sp. AF18-8]RGT65106.1 hypothetical protein DWX16_07165 [Collinsella sp. AF18-33LB]
MSKTIVRPTLSLGNHIYLYRLLRDALGCGKQTFMTQVEEALAAGDMTAYDLGFESTRELLEELDDCIKLTVFKGGRLYATVIANEAWDAALAKGEDKPKAVKGAKQSYKKKKRGEKDLKAVRPKHVKRTEPEAMVEAVPEPEPETEIEVAIEVTAEAETEIATTTDSEAMSDQEATVELNETPTSTIEETAGQPEAPVFQNSDVFGDNAEDGQSDEPADQNATEATPEPETPQPAISLTVVYDPENANAGITTMASTPVETKPSVETEDAPQTNTKTEAEDTSVPVEPTDSAAKPEAAPESAAVIESVPTAACDQIPAPAPASAPVAAPTPAPAAPTTPEDFPIDFATEVFCPGPLLHQLSTYLPYGADTLGIVGEYYWIARERGTIEAARNRASFPLRYTQAGERHEVTVRIRRNTTGGLGATWAIDKVEPSTK